MPGITRRPERFDLHEKRRVGGRVHAVVMPPLIETRRLCPAFLQWASPLNLRPPNVAL